MSYFFLLFILAFLFSYLGIFCMYRWARKRILDVPNIRSSHTQPTPRGGGLFVVLCTLAGFWLSCLFFPELVPLRIAFYFSLSAILVALVSWFDDLYILSNWARFTTHSVGALLILQAGWVWQWVAFPFGPSISLGWVGYPVTFFWIVGLTNVYNFMDGIDGLAGGQAVVGGVAWIGLGLMKGEPLASVLGVLVAGGSLGFLGHNWPPARIFLGDVGSAFLGFSFAALPLILNLTDPWLPITSFLVVWPFIFDATFSLLRRLRRGENIFAPHRSHLYQRLIIAGYGHRFVSSFYIFLALIGMMLAFTITLDYPGGHWLVACVPGLLCFGLWRFVVWAENTSTRET